MPEPNRRTLYLIDGPNIAFRAFFAIGGMTSPSGLPTNALYGFTNMLVKLIRDERPGHLAIVWDPKDGSFRNEMLPSYKGTRPDMPESLVEQIPHFARIAEAFAIPYLCEEGFEADDVIGTLAKRWSDEVDVVIVSSDKDLMQLVSNRVTLLDTMKDRRIGPAEVREKFGCPPRLVPDALGIWGDSSDNIPGVKGIGEKGVHKLLATFDGLDDLYARLDEVTPPSVRTKLEHDRDNAFLSRELATIRADVPIDLDLNDLELTYPPPSERPRELFSELGFRSLLREFGGAMVAIDRDRYRLVLDEPTLLELRDMLAAAGRFAVDCETTDLEARIADLVGLSVCCDDSTAWYIPVGHRYLGCPEQLSWSRVREVLGPLLEAPEVALTGQNLKYDSHVLARHGVELGGIAGDTLLADYLLEPDRRSHGLNDLALIHLQHKMISYEEAVAGRDSFAAVPVEDALAYAGEDAHVAWLLDRRLDEQLDSVQLTQLYRELELPLIPVLARMENAGIAVNRDLFGTLLEELSERIEETEHRCWELAGEQFTIASVKQLRTILFDRLGLPVLKRTKTGPSTAEAVLAELAMEHPLPQAILDHRSLVKLKNTYVEPLPGMIDPATGRIHTHFSQTTAATGRLSSVEPNLQNIPVRTPEGRRIRQAFVAPEGRLLLSADYSQVELRVLAHLCGGTGTLAEAFASGTDVHAQTAAGLMGVELDQVTREMRSIAKAVNFGIIYGQSAFGLAQSLGIPRRDAKAYIERYKERYPEIEAYRQHTLEEARASGVVTTILGRRRPVPDLASGNFVQRSQAERIAVNTPVQGSAADIIKRAMLAVDARLRSEFADQKLLLQVHDELLLEVDESAAEAVGSMVREEMVNAIELSVPLVVDIGTGRTWDEAH